MGKKDNTYWHPYPALLLRLGFKQSEFGGKNNYIFRGGPYGRYSIHWGLEGGPGSDPYLELKAGSGTHFYGMVDSEEELLTLLRQVRWEVSP